jgi:hypothetical protein
MVALYDLFVLLELALYFIHGILDGGVEIGAAGFAEIIHVIAGYVKMRNMLLVFVGDHPFGVKLAVEKTVELAGFIVEELLDISAFGVGMFKYKFHLHKNSVSLPNPLK